MTGESLTPDTRQEQEKSAPGMLSVQQKEESVDREELITEHTLDAKDLAMLASVQKTFKINNLAPEGKVYHCEYKGHKFESRYSKALNAAILLVDGQILQNQEQRADNEQARIFRGKMEGFEAVMNREKLSSERALSTIRNNPKLKKEFEAEADAALQDFLHPISKKT